MGTVDYLTDLANALEVFFKGLSECGLLSCYSVQLQVSTLDYVVQIKFHCLMYQFMKTLQALLLKSTIPGHENSHDIGIQTPSDFNSVFISSKRSESDQNDQLGSLVETCVFSKTVSDIDWPDGDSCPDKDHPAENFDCSENQNATFVVHSSNSDIPTNIIVTCNSATLAAIAEQSLVSSSNIDHNIEHKLDLSDNTINDYRTSDSTEEIDHLEPVSESNIDICNGSNKDLSLCKEQFIQIENSEELVTDVTVQSGLKSLDVDVSPLILKSYVEEEMLDVSSNLNEMHIIVASENIEEKQNTSPKSDKEKKKPYKCKDCNKSFTSVQSLDLHFNRKHSAKEQCDMCSRSFSSVQSLQEHCKLDHEGMGCFNCCLCNRRFMTKLSYKRHMDTHVGKKEAVCDVCGKTFSRADYLNKHYMTHSGTKPLSCSRCPRKFISTSHLKNHEKTHTGEREHVCKICPKSFSRADKLKEHTLRHLNIKRFQCSLCKRTYAEKRDLTKHMRIHEKLEDCDKVIS